MSLWSLCTTVLHHTHFNTSMLVACILCSNQNFNVCTLECTVLLNILHHKYEMMMCKKGKKMCLDYHYFLLWILLQFPPLFVFFLLLLVSSECWKSEFYVQFFFFIKNSVFFAISPQFYTIVYFYSLPISFCIILISKKSLKFEP